MDNSKYYNDSLAYDFELFLPKEKKEPDKNKIVKMKPRKRTSPKQAAVNAVASRIKTAAIIAFMLSVVCANIFLRAKITETDNKISSIKSEITELEGEQTRLNVEFESRISYRNIEEAAAALGMKKTDRTQVVYIKTNTKDAARTQNGLLSASNEE